MEDENVQKIESVENDIVEPSSSSPMSTSSEILKTSEVQASDENQVHDNSAPINSNGSDTPSNDVVVSGGGMTTSQSIASPDDVVPESYESGTDVASSDVVEEAETEIKKEGKVDEADDINVDGEFLTKEEPVTSSNGSGSEVVHSDVFEGVQMEIKDEEKVVVADDIKAEKEFPCQLESVTSPDDLVAESNGSVTGVANSDVVTEIETENKDQLNVGVTDDVKPEEECNSKEESASLPDHPVTKSHESVTEVTQSDGVEEVVTEIISNEEKVKVADDISAEEEFSCKGESVTKEAPSEVVKEVEVESKDQVKAKAADDINAEEEFSSKGESITEGAASDVVKEVEVESKDQVKDEVADDMNAAEEFPSKEESDSSRDDVVTESSGSVTDVATSDVVEEVATENKDQVKAGGVADDISAEEVIPSKEESDSPSTNFSTESNESGTHEEVSEEVKKVETEVQNQVKDETNTEQAVPSKVDEKDDFKVGLEDSGVASTVQEVSAPATHLEIHSAVASHGTTETTTNNVFDNSVQKPTDAIYQEAFKKDDYGLEMKSVEADQSQSTVSSDFSKCPASLDADLQSLEVQKDPEDSNHSNDKDETSASEVFHEEQKHEKQEELEMRTDEENFTSPMAALGTDYAALARSQSSDSNVSDGRSSQEPVNRTQVEKVTAPEITKNVRMMFESGQIQDLHEVKKTVASLEEPTDSGVFENEPVQREGVVRSGEYVNDVDDVQKGATKNLLNQWKDKGKEEFKADKKPINLAEDEGRVLENEPVRRSDVVREEDCDQTQELPSKGQARILTQQWISRKDDFAKEQKPIKLFENETEPSVVENQPEVRMDVLREDDNTEEIWLRKGFTKDLAGYWAGPKEEVRGPRDAIDLGQEADGVIAENEPTRLEGVVRGDDLNEEVLPIEKGRARSMVSKWSTLPEEAARQPFQLDVNTHEAGVYENEPIQLEGVVRGTSQVDEVLGQKGMIKNIAGRFIHTEEGPRNRKEMIVIDKAEGPSILENDPEPVRADVVRGEYTAADEPQVEKGTTKNLVHIWKTQDLTTQRQNVDRSDPSWMLEAEKAAESGVFENQPQVRSDVFREVDYEPEMISVTETRNMRAKWSKMGLDDGQKPDKAPELVRFTPPRELTPPRVNQEEFKSYQALTLSSDSTFTACGPSPTTNGSNRTTAAQPRSPVYSPGGSSYPAQSPSGDQTIKSSATLVLKSS